ncbi:MAG: nitroreductase family protein [Clostridia bacterium]|nr:nitroreductase family protein [Clostridia bacterium]MBQ9252153.1 nitroreductase family protein [Clostridia bacterium]
MNEALNNLLTRRSCRAYEDRQIKNEELDAILEAGQYAPTGMGKQSPLIVAIQDAETIRRLEKLNAGAMGKEDAHTFYGAPTVIVVFGHSESQLELADANLVIGNLLNAANAVGLDSCYIWRARESFETEEGKAMKAAWGIPEEYVGVGNVILGYGKPEGKRPAAPRKEDYIHKV